MVLCVKCIGERLPCKLFCKHCVCLASHSDVNIKCQAVCLSVTLLGRSSKYFNAFFPLLHLTMRTKMLGNSGLSPCGGTAGFKCAAQVLSSEPG